MRLKTRKTKIISTTRIMKISLRVAMARTEYPKRIKGLQQDGKISFLLSPSSIYEI